MVKIVDDSFSFVCVLFCMSPPFEAVFLELLLPPKVYLAARTEQPAFEALIGVDLLVSVFPLYETISVFSAVRFYIGGTGGSMFFFGGTTLVTTVVVVVVSFFLDLELVLTLTEVIGSFYYLKASSSRIFSSKTFP